MILSAFILLFGLFLILAGANFLTDGAASIAKRMGISDLVVGLTVVAFGTSAPEFVISVVSALNGSDQIAIGNVVGSNIFNILVIIGITALVAPIKVEKSLMTKEIPLVILSSLALLIISNKTLLDGCHDAMISRCDGLILLLFFAIFMRYIFSQASSADSDPVAETSAGKQSLPIWRAAIYVIGGLAGLIYGGDRFVAGASDIAAKLGISEAIIGLTIVATGTSLPELATSIAAALKGNQGIAIGNVIGSNIFNIFLVLGSAATIQPLAFKGITNDDMTVLMTASILFLLFARFFRKRTITRVEGALLTAIYCVYITILILKA